MKWIKPYLKGLSFISPVDGGIEGPVHWGNKWLDLVGLLHHPTLAMLARHP